MTPNTPSLHIGTAGWGLPRAVADAFPGEGALLERYARVLGCTEVNTTFSRTHRAETFARWAAQTPGGFRFSVKLPKAFTHEDRLMTPRAEVAAFVASLAGLGEHLAVLLVQLPPSLALDVSAARSFFRSVRTAFSGAIVCEPRHASWFTGRAQRLLEDEHIGRVAADPPRHPGAGEPGGWLGEHRDGQGAVVYHRWHGSPRVYWSAYDDDWLDAKARALMRWPAATDVWCIFDNTAKGAACDDALRLTKRMAKLSA
ncbi:MAG: DUF72 domain-containing protein [Hydrogenophaga sp.]|uniref:DUF72 domain-containing protein n=1 Tax=Hydrogenophaga sp. TaxID=1904254 RepID=UPI00262F64A0|nr:DUF72 domain-containing protein [Hydrogenophaga sp.]MCW5671951.1 DUF72 domain-containing protein [Hydrogenophaga sp.]